MPPKSGKKKLTKAEKEKLKKEEAERKLQEEEEARLLAEQKEKDKKRREKLEAEERRRTENEERKIRKAQMHELDAMWDSQVRQLQHELTDIWQKAKWDRYMLCNGSPDPTIPGEINTYMNLWQEDNQHNDITSVLSESDIALGLISELECLIEETPKDELAENDEIRYRNTIISLQSLLAHKLDLATYTVLQRATELQDTETFNLQKVISNDVITLCTWGNLSKNPRIRSFEFPEQGITFDIPRLLTLSDCAIRILFTKYDHLSPQSKSFLPRIKKKLEEAVPTEEVVEEEKQDEEKKEEVEGEVEPLEREETEDVMAALNALNKSDDDIGETEEAAPKEEEEAPEEMEEDYDIKTPEPEEFDDFDGDEDAVDLRAYHVMGGVYHFDLVHLPPQPKVAKSWLLTQVIDPPELDYISYVSDSVNAQLNTTKDEKKEKEGGEEKKKDEKPPITVTRKLPGDVYFCEEPQVARWDAGNKQWRLDGFSDHKFDEENGVISFKTSYFGTLCLLQDAHINMPFQSWEIRPRDIDNAILTIIAAIVEVQIEIKEDKCRLIQPQDRPELEHIRGQWYKPLKFAKVLQQAGLNLFPASDSAKYVSIQNKNPIAEDKLYQQMSLTSSAMAYSWSKWNSEVKSDEKIIIQAAEKLEDEPLLEEDWSLFAITKKKSTKLKMTEFNDAFSDEMAEGVNFHSNVYHLVSELVSNKAMERIRDTNFKFVDCVYKVLQSTHLVTYS